MRNILILHNSLDYHKSGVERVSFLLKKEFEYRGYNCYEGCVKGGGAVHQKDVFEYNFNDSKKKVSKNLSDYVKRCKIDVIIIQGIFDPNINNALFCLKKNCECKVIFCLHNNPSANGRKRMLSILNRIKIFVWNLVKFHLIIFDYRNHRLRMLADMYGLADRFVLLSKNHIDELSEIINIQDFGKISCINNPSPFHPPQINYFPKKNQVLILGRLEEFFKNISSALRIWKIIENFGTCDWNLVIVGSGVDEKRLKNYAADLGLKRVTFVGETFEPEKYYQESSLFMMTSHSEGWPLTLLEAQQYGCIPIVFNTFASLSEIIENGVNGFVVEKYDESSFAQKIIELMRNDCLRKEIARNCMDNCQKFSSNVIGDKWDSLLKEL